MVGEAGFEPATFGFGEAQKIIGDQADSTESKGVGAYQSVSSSLIKILKSPCAPTIMFHPRMHRKYLLVTLIHCH